MIARPRPLYRRKPPRLTNTTRQDNITPMRARTYEQHNGDIRGKRMKEHDEEIHEEAYRVAWVKLLHEWYSSVVKELFKGGSDGR